MDIWSALGIGLKTGSLYPVIGRLRRHSRNLTVPLVVPPWPPLVLAVSSLRRCSTDLAVQFVSPVYVQSIYLGQRSQIRLQGRLQVGSGTIRLIYTPSAQEHSNVLHAHGTTRSLLSREFQPLNRRRESRQIHPDGRPNGEFGTV